MIRRDYILQMIEEFGRALAQVRISRQRGRWGESQQAIDAECEILAAAGARELAQLSETELLARLAQGQPAFAVRQKLFFLITLLEEAAATEGDQGRAAPAHALRLKALHLLLEALAQEDASEFPEFVPRVEPMLAALSDAPLPPTTHALLMRHYEATRQWSKAEDALFSLLDTVADDPAAIELGRAFYQRILSQSDASLAEGNLPRLEADEGLAELLQRARERRA
jgi:hypothetical protein